MTFLHFLVNTDQSVPCPLVAFAGKGNLVGYCSPGGSGGLWGSVSDGQELSLDIAADGTLTGTQTITDHLVRSPGSEERQLIHEAGWDGEL
jgi:hypothetical protein